MAVRGETTSAASAASAVKPPFLGDALADIYQFPEGDGSGQVIAVLSVDGSFDPADVERHMAIANLPSPTIDVVDVGEIDAREDDATITMVICITATVVPAASFVVFRGPNTTQGYVDTVGAMMRSDRRPNICVITYGSEELDFDDSARQRVERELQTAAENGVTIVVSVGDVVGEIMYPASSPWVLACGATTLNVSNTGERSEKRWLGVSQNARAKAADRGALRESSFFPRPEWQQAQGLAPGRRAVPDVSAVGDPKTGYLVTFGGKQLVVGGTTGSAALWAGLVARLNQRLGRNLGHLNPALYRLAGTGALDPIREGPASAEWYQTTGLGVPNGRRLLKLLSTSTSDHMVAYEPDDLQASDDLEFTQDVNVLASLVAARSVRPPVSVGLFGDWGSGKSFFMRMLSDRVDLLAEQSRRARTAEQPRETLFCSNVVQINFNAWHYIDANLWASLAARIFEGLSEHSQADSSYVDALAHLQTSKLLLADATSRRDAAEAALASAQNRLTVRKSELATVQNAIADSPALTEAAERLSEAVGKPVSESSLQELAQMSDDLHGSWRELRAGWQAVDTSRGPWSRRRVLAVLGAFGVVAVAGVAWAVASNAAVKGWLTIVGSLMASAIVVAAALLPVARDASRMAVRILGHAERRRNEEIARLDSKVQDRIVDVERAQLEVDHAQRPGAASVYQFIEERYRSEDYRGQLGLLGLIQRDLRALSDRLTAASATDDGSLAIERVVLYVDDLDRCPPALVVQVLQAVHLLLAFPLFVVVVGVDSRWLVRALQHEYAVMLDRSDARTDVVGETAYWAATPQNYLEKIFQIPFWIRGMRKETFGRLIRSLTAEPVRLSELGDAQPATASSAGAREAEPDGTDAPAATHADFVPAAAAEEVDLAPRQLLLSAQEEEFIVDLAAFVTTPRMAKRFVNIYRLLRAYVRDLDEFTGTTERPGAYREVALLVAIVVGQPYHAGEVLDRLENASGDDLSPWIIEFSTSEALAHDHARQDGLRPALEGIAPKLNGTSIATAREWIPLIRRFSMIRGAQSVGGGHVP